MDNTLGEGVGSVTAGLLLLLTASKRKQKNCNDILFESDLLEPHYVNLAETTQKLAGAKTV